MPGPGIASATISVDLNGDRIPAEAAVLGREAGAIMGKEHNRSYADELDAGLSRVGKKLTDEFRTSGKSSALSFRDAFQANVLRDMDKVAQDVANVFSDPRGFETFRKEIAGVDEDMAGVGRTADELRGRLDFLRSNGQFGSGLQGYNLFQSLRKDINDWEKSAGTIDSTTARIRRDLEDAATGGRVLKDGMVLAEGGVRDVVRAAEAGGRGLDGLGKEFEKAGSSAGRSRGGIGLWTGAILALIGIVTAIVPEIAALGSALGGLSLEGGLAFGALGVGAIAFVESLKGMFGPLNALPAAVQPAAKALQNLFGSVDSKGKFAAGGMLKDLQILLQTHVFENLAGSINKFATGAFPAFQAGVASIGDALHGIIADFATAFTEPQNLRDFQGVIVGMGPILKTLGDAAIQFGRGFAALFATATPFAKAFAGHIEDIAKGFADFLSSKKGRDDVTLWLQNAEKVAPHIGKVFSDLAGALHGLVTPASISNLNTLLDVLGGALLSLGKLLGTMTEIGPAFNDLLKGVFNVVDAITPSLDAVLNGVSDLVVGLLKVLVPLIDGVISLLEPIFKAIGTELSSLGQALGTLAPLVNGLFGGIEAAAKPVVDLIANGLTFALAHTSELVKAAAPVYKALGDTFLAMGQLIGAIIQGFVDAAGAVLGFQDGSKTVSEFINGPFAGSLKDIAGHIQDFADVIRTQAIPWVKDELVPAFKNFIATAVDEVIPGLIVMGQNFVDFIHLVGSLIPAITGVATVLGDLGGVAGAVGRALVDAISGPIKVFVDVLHRNFVAAVVDAGIAMKNGVTDAHNLGSAIGKTAKDGASAFQTLLKAGSSALGDIHSIITRTQGYFAQLSKDGQDKLLNLAHNFGLTGDKAKAFEGLVASASNGSKSQLNKLANDRSLSQVEHDLGLTGGAAKAFEAAMKVAMGGSSAAADGTKTKVDNLHYAVVTLPNGKHIVVTETGAAAAQAAVEALNSQLRALHDRQITISVNAQVNSKYAQGLLGNEFGGVVAGGQQIAGGRHAFAFGGLVNTPTSYGNVLAGEAGLEAIVPLTKPLDQVDKSVRQLAAYARGMGDGYGNGPQKVVNVNQNITVPTADPVAAAGYVVDRLVPRL